MFKVIKKNESRLDIEFSGKLNSGDMRVALDDLIDNAKEIEHGRILYRILDFDIPTLGALGVEFSRLPEIFRLMKKFDRVAVLANKKWVKKVGEIEGAFIPGLEIKAFDLDEEAEAENWLAN